MERDTDVDNNIQLRIIKLSSSIRQTIKSAQDVVYFSQKRDKEKELKSALLRLNFLIHLTNKRFIKLNKDIKKNNFFRKTILSYEKKAYYSWNGLMIPILDRLIIHHKIMAKKAFMEPLFINMYKHSPSYAPMMQSGFEHRIKDAIYFHLVLNIVFITISILFFIIFLLFLVGISSKELKEKDLRRKLKENEELFGTMVNGMVEGIYINDTKILYANPSALKFFGYQEKELYDMYIWDLFGEKDRPVVKANIEKRLKGERFYTEYRFDTFTKKGEEKYVMFHVQTVVYQGRFVALAVFFDITDKVLLEKQLEKERLQFQELSEVDYLTGIFNRRKLEKFLEGYVKLAVRYNRPLSLIMFDIDHFKSINDNYGHQIGDNVLIEIADLVKTNLRETDFFARFGGEEFMILMPETNLSYAKAKAENLRKLIEENIFKYIYGLTCSFGVIEYGKKDNSDNMQDIVSGLIGRVDNALYRAKENGRNRVEEDI
ncbi:MAG: sensor domain-containing diguanylate cyclase [bacterium]